MTNLEVAHRWANQTQARASSGHMRFEGNTIYSYTTPIAKLHTVNGIKLAIATPVKYSVTTQKHKSYVFTACSHLYIIGCHTLSLAQCKEVLK